MKLFTHVGAAMCDAVDASADELNRLDAQAGDGDLGVTMRTAASLVRDLLASAEELAPSATLRASGLAIARGAPSTSGTLVASGFLRAATVVGTGQRQRPAAELAAILRAAVDGIADRGKAQIGGKTMLDALVPAAEAAGRCAARGGPLRRALVDAAEAAEDGARATSAMKAVHGRAGWLADRSAGHEDAGARMIAIAIQAAARALQK